MSETKPKLKRLKRIMRIVAIVAILLAIAGGGVLLAINAKKSPSAESETVSQETIKRPAQPVRVTTAKQRSIQAWVFAEGTARSVNRQYLTFDRAGRVTFVKASIDGGDLRAGESVKKGEVLARLDRRQYESEIDSATATVEEAKTQLEVAQTDITQAETQSELAAAKFRRIEQLLSDRATSKAEHEEVEANMKNAQAAVNAARAKAKALGASVNAAEAKLRQSQLALDETEIASPIDGIIAYLNIEEGYYFTQSNIRTTSESDALLTVPIVVIDPSEYEITVDIPSYEAESVTRGQEVLLIPGGMSATSAFTVSAGTSQSNGAEPHWKAKGRVFSINPAVNPGGRSVQIRIRTTQGADQLRDGMFVACWIKVREKPDAIVAPFDAFLFEENRPYVFVVDRQGDRSEAGVARRVDVQVGIESLAAREILSGVAPGEQLVTDGRYRLVTGAPVRVVGDDGMSESATLAEGETGLDLGGQ